MKKLELQELKSGDYVQNIKSGEVLEVVGMDAEAGKYILSNGKTYSKSTIKRWFDVVEIPEVVEPDNTILDDIEQADELTSEQYTTVDTEEQEDTDTTATTVNTDTVNELHEEQDTAVKNEVVEGNTTTNSTAKTNTVQPTIQQDNLIQSLNNLVDLHGCYLQAKKEYIAVKKDGYKGTVCMIRNCRYGNGIHIDMKSKVFAQLTEEYRDLLIEQYGCRVYDASRGYMRVFDCNDIEVLQTIILTAKQVG